MKKQKEKLLPYCSICKTEYSCKEYETGIAHQDKQTPHKQKCECCGSGNLGYGGGGGHCPHCPLFHPPTPKQDKPQEEYRMTEICPKCGKSTSTRITSAEQERDEILNSKELRVSPLCKDCQPPQKEGRENDTYTYEETLETVKKLSKLMQKEGWVQMCFWTNKHKEVVDAIHSVKGVRVDDFIVSENDIILALEQEHKNLLATERQEHEILVNTLLATKNAELKKERQKVEEMIKRQPKEHYMKWIPTDEQKGYMKACVDILNDLKKLRTKEGDIKS